MSVVVRLGASLVVLAVILSGCSSSDSTKSPRLEVSGEWTGDTPLKTGTIGLLNSLGSSENQAHWEQVARDAIDAIGWEAKVTDGKGDPAVQGQAISAFVQQDVDAILIIGGVSTETITSPLTAANEADIPVLVTGVQSPDPQELFAGQFAPDDGEFGTVMAEYLVDELPPGSPWGAMLITAFPGGDAPNVTALPILQENGHERVATIDLDISGDISTQVSKGVVDMLSANPDIKLLFGCCDFTAALTAPALKQAGYDDVVQAVRYDNLSTLQLIADGYPVVVTAVNEVTGVFAAVSSIAANQSTGAPIDDAVMDGKYEYTVVDADNLPEPGEYFYPDQDQFDSWIEGLQSEYSK